MAFEDRTAPIDYAATAAHIEDLFARGYANSTTQHRPSRFDNGNEARMHRHHSAGAYFVPEHHPVYNKWYYSQTNLNYRPPNDAANQPYEPSRIPPELLQELDELRRKVQALSSANMQLGERADSLQAALNQREIDHPTELGGRDRRIAELEAEIQELKSRPDIIREPHGLGPEFDFEERVYECLINSPGVGYRNSPKFGDKNKDGTGPVAPQCIVANAICQGKSAVFVRDKRNGLWLPLSSPDGQPLFKHHDRCDFLDMSQYAGILNSGKDKLVDMRSQQQDLWFSPRQD